MKKWIAVIIALIMCLPLAGCGKSDAVKAVEAMMKALPEFTESSKADYYAANAAYQALSSEEQEKVSTRKKFYAQLDPYFTQMVADTWYPFDLQLEQLDSLENPLFAITLRADGTAFAEYPFAGNENGTWTVEYGVLTVSGFTEVLSYNNGCSNPKNLYPFIISTDGDTLRLAPEDFHFQYMRLDDYMTELSKVVKIVDLSVENIADYAYFDHYEEHETDEFGAHTGWVYDVYYLRSKLYDEGWYYFSCSEDLAIEYHWPARDFTAVNIESGRETPNHNDANSSIISYSPFRINTGVHFTKRTDYMIIKDDKLTADDFTFGRTKGKLYFINAEYIKEVRQRDGEYRDLILDTEKYPFCGWEVLNAGMWEDDNQWY